MRVFISSTFRDMQLEREELVKQVFSRLRKLCESRGVSWSEIDLRWGVTDEQRAEGRVLPICLAEIHRPAVLHRSAGRALWLAARGTPQLVRAYRPFCGRQPLRFASGCSTSLRPFG